jgi:hypothetical protein
VLLHAAGALQALLTGHCASCQQLQQQLEAANARAEAAEFKQRVVFEEALDGMVGLREQLEAAQAENQQLREQARSGAGIKGSKE